MRLQANSGSVCWALGALLAAAAPLAVAHHGISNWDQNKDIKITGVLTKIELINPHSWIHVDVTGPDGKVVPWRCEMRAVVVLQRSGWTVDMFKIGSTITITGSPERRKPNLCYLGTITFADGSQMDRYSQRVAATPQAAAATKPVRAARTAAGSPQLRRGLGCRTARHDRSSRAKRCLPAPEPGAQHWRRVKYLRGSVPFQARAVHPSRWQMIRSRRPGRDPLR